MSPTGSSSSTADVPSEQGTHETLLARGGVYRKLYDAQNVDPAFVRKHYPGDSAAKDDVGGDLDPIRANSVGEG